MQTALAQQCAGRQRRHDPPERQPRQAALDHERDKAHRRDEDQNRDRSGYPTRRRGRAFAVEGAVQRPDQGAHPGHRMADHGHEPIRIADHELEQEGEKGECGGHRA